MNVYVYVSRTIDTSVFHFEICIVRMDMCLVNVEPETISVYHRIFVTVNIFTNKSLHIKIQSKVGIFSRREIVFQF